MKQCSICKKVYANRYNQCECGCILEVIVDRNQYKVISSSKPESQLSTTPPPVKCPKCNSTQITMNKRGWKLTTGFLGSSKMLNTCMNCGNQWNPKG